MNAKIKSEWTYEKTCITLPLTMPNNDWNLRSKYLF